MPRLGWIPDFPDHRDWVFAAPRASTMLASQYSNREQQSPVRDQGSIGSCVGMAVTAAVEYLRRTDLDEFSTIYSPLHAYYEARKVRGWEHEDTGAMIRDAVKMLTKEGAAPESAWPYKTERFADPPHKTAVRKAQRWRLGSYYSCDSLDRVVAAISQGLPVVGGFSVYQSMFSADVDRTGAVPMPGKNDSLLGGHAVLFVGFDYTSGRVEFKNSWSTGWGDAGYGSLPMEYVDDPDLADDFWALTSESEASFRGQAP